MNRRVCGGAVGLVFLVMAAGLARESGSRAGAEGGWLTDYAEARKVAARDGKPMLVVFRCPH